MLSIRGTSWGRAVAPDKRMLSIVPNTLAAAETAGIERANGAESYLSELIGVSYPIGTAALSRGGISNDSPIAEREHLRDRMGLAVDAELPLRRVDVEVHRRLRKVQDLRDVPGRLAFRGPEQHVDLAAREVRRRLLRARGAQIPGDRVEAQREDVQQRLVGFDVRARLLLVLVVRQAEDRELPARPVDGDDDPVAHEIGRAKV